MDYCECGSRVFIEADFDPVQCPTCRLWVATALKDWDGRCNECGAAITEEAKRRERSPLDPVTGYLLEQARKSIKNRS
jgi:hypothetical protein